MATSTTVKSETTAAFEDGTLTVEAGDAVWLYTSNTAGIPGNAFVTFYYDTPGVDHVAFTLSGGNMLQAIGCRANLIAKKTATSIAIGVGKFS